MKGRSMKYFLRKDEQGVVQLAISCPRALYEVYIWVLSLVTLIRRLRLSLQALDEGLPLAPPLNSNLYKGILTSITRWLIRRTI